MSQMLDIGWRKTIEGGPKHCENQQESSIFDSFWSGFWEINTSRTLLDPKNEDPESYRPIRAKKFRTRFCGHLFSHQLQNSAYLPLGKGFPTTWGGCKWVKWVICELYCGMDWLDTGGFVGSGGFSAVAVKHQSLIKNTLLYSCLNCWLYNLFVSFMPDPRRNGNLSPYG